VYQDDSSIVDKGGLFAPEISLVNMEELWPVTAAAKVAEITSAIYLRARAQSLVETGAAVNIRGAEAVLNTTIDLLATHRR
jgi:choline dehydrogenase